MWAGKIPPTSLDLASKKRDSLLAAKMVAYSEVQTAFGAAACKNLTAISCCHSFAETMLVNSLSVRRLKCSFHCRILIFDYNLHNSECKCSNF